MYTASPFVSSGLQVSTSALAPVALDAQQLTHAGKQERQQRSGHVDRPLSCGTFHEIPTKPPGPAAMHPPIWNRQDRTIWLTARLRLFWDALAD